VPCEECLLPCAPRVTHIVDTQPATAGEIRGGPVAGLQRVYSVVWCGFASQAPLLILVLGAEGAK